MTKTNGNSLKFLSSKDFKDTLAKLQKISGMQVNKNNILGKGGCSTVFLAKTKDNKKILAIKITYIEPSEKEKNPGKFELMKKLAKQDSFVSYNLNHKSVIKTFGCFEINDHSYSIVMQRASFSLTDVIHSFYKRNLFDVILHETGKSFFRFMSSNLIKHYFIQMISGLNYINDSQLIHRDVKPDNFLVVGKNLKLSDFNLTIQKDTKKELTELQNFGTFSYLAPEFYQTKKVYKTNLLEKFDVFALGCILFKMLFDKYLFEKKPEEKIKQDDLIKQITVNLQAGLEELKKRKTEKTLMHLLINTLHPNPEKRHTIKKVYESCWVNENRKAIEEIEALFGNNYVKMLIELQKSNSIRNVEKGKKFNVPLWLRKKVSKST